VLRVFLGVWVGVVCAYVCGKKGSVSSTVLLCTKMTAQVYVCMCVCGGVVVGKKRGNKG
jgi:hypothetical protein